MHQSSFYRQLPLFFSVVLSAIMVLSSCKKQPMVESGEQHSVLITELQLKDSQLPLLEKTFFSIDHRTGKIYNARPLPMGSKIGVVALRMESDTYSKATIYVAGKEMPLSDSVDMTKHREGVLIHMTNSKYPGVSKDYTLSIQIYDRDPYSYNWVKSPNQAPQPTGGSDLILSRLVETEGGFYYLGRTPQKTRLWRADYSTPTQWEEINIGSHIDSPIIDIAAYMPDGVSCLQENGSEVIYTHSKKLWEQSNLLRETPVYLLGSLYYRGKNTNLVAITKDGKLHFSGESKGAEVPSHFPLEHFTCINLEQEYHPIALLLGGTDSKGQTMIWSTSNGNDWLSLSDAGISSGIPSSTLPGCLVYEPTDNTLMLLKPVTKDGKQELGIFLSSDKGTSWVRKSAATILPEVYQQATSHTEGLSIYRGQDGKLYLFGGLDGTDRSLWVGTPIRF